jgi:hypothetical protein
VLGSHHDFPAHRSATATRFDSVEIGPNASAANRFDFVSRSSAALPARTDGGAAVAVAALEVKTRQALASGRDFGSVGRYTQLDGTAHFAIDPNHPLNRCITDIDLAPRDGDGLVHFSADIRILTPEDPQRGNHRVLFDVPNRGNRLALATFNRVPRPINPQRADRCGR